MDKIIRNMTLVIVLLLAASLDACFLGPIYDEHQNLCPGREPNFTLGNFVCSPMYALEPSCFDCGGRWVQWGAKICVAATCLSIVTIVLVNLNRKFQEKGWKQLSIYQRETKE